MRSFWRQRMDGEWIYATREEQRRLAAFLELPFEGDEQEWEVEVSDYASPSDVNRAFACFQEPGIRASVGWLLIAIAEDLVQVGDGERGRDLIDTYSSFACAEPATHAFAIWYWTGGELPARRFGVSELLMPLREIIQRKLEQNRSSGTT